MSEQQYEDYWKITLSYTDFNGNNFLEALEFLTVKSSYA